MLTPAWQLKNPINAIIFDCDGTLSTIEGIDTLAAQNKVGEPVHRLTAEAMGKSGMSLDLYEKRLNLVKPTQQQIHELGEEYFLHIVPDVFNVIQIFKKLKKSIYIISAGLLPSVIDFGKRLQIPAENIYAVDIYFDHQGNYSDFDRTSPFIHKHGKREVVTQLKTHHNDLIYIGDGLSDYEVVDLVKRFVGYGGAYYRENIAEQCQFYIKTLSMAALLPLSLTEDEYKLLSPPEQEIYQRGVSDINQNRVIVKN